LFTRYWVCEDYYAVGVVWSEPHGIFMRSTLTQVILSDKTGVRMSNDRSKITPRNKTYPKPVGEKGPYVRGWGGTRVPEMRFAEAEALARRVYLSDLGLPKDDSQDADEIVDVEVPQRADGVKRKLARLKAHIRDNRIESMELFNEQQELLGRMSYEYERNGNALALTKLVGDLPVRPQKLAVEITVASKSATDDDGEKKKAPAVTETFDYVRHKGGRTCTVTYQDVAMGDAVLRFPAHIEVRAGDDGRLLRSARLINFKRVNLDKAGVWDAAQAFVGLSREDRAYDRFRNKYFASTPDLGPMQVDPNDLASVKRLMAKYPVPETRFVPPPSHRPGLKPLIPPKWATTEDGRLDPTATQELKEARKREVARWRERKRKHEERMQEWREEQANRISMPDRMKIEPNDVRVIRQLCQYYGRRYETEEAKRLFREQGWYHGQGIKRRNPELYGQLRRILAYHYDPSLPEDRPPEVEPNDLKMIRQLQEHYEKLAAQQDCGPGGRLRAVNALTRLDRMLQDCDAFEEHTRRYLEMLREAGLVKMYMEGAWFDLQRLGQAGAHEKANKLMHQWAIRAVSDIEAASILSYLRKDTCTAGFHSWTDTHLLDQFLRKPDLSALQRYEALALRAIALDRTDRFLSDPETALDEECRARAQWILSTMSKEQLAKEVNLALLRAFSAWQSLGTAATSDAKPYSTAKMSALKKNSLNYGEATPLQETSALLMNVIRARGAQVVSRQSGTTR
jgi:hypothetical protein